MSRFVSNSFRKGFAAGLAAPYRFLMGVPLARRQSNFVAKSWAEVGSTIRTVTSEGFVLSDKTASSREPRTRKYDPIRN